MTEEGIKGSQIIIKSEADNNNNNEKKMILTLISDEGLKFDKVLLKTFTKTKIYFLEFPLKLYN